MPADSMEGVVSEKEQPSPEEIHEKAVAGKFRFC